MPFISPRLAPFFVVHHFPCGPSATYGMRSRSAAEAFSLNSSGGSQQRSTWQSAEIISYFMPISLEKPHREGRQGPYQSRLPGADERKSKASPRRTRRTQRTTFQTA